MYAALSELELMMDRANDLIQFRIEAVLHEMSTTTLCEMPEDEPWTVEHFIEKTQVWVGHSPKPFWGHCGMPRALLENSVIRTITLCEMPEDKPWTVEHFIEKTQVHVIRIIRIRVRWDPPVHGAHWLGFGAVSKNKVARLQNN